MLDPAFVRDNPDAVRERLAARGKRMDAELEALAALESERRALIPKVEELKRQQNASGEEVARAKKAGQDASHLFAANKARGAEIKTLEAELDGIETHDCFTTTEYMAIDHFGITPPGESWRAIEGGDIEVGGRIPVNPSGGLIGTGHPVGATGVRMALDCYKQVTGTAGEYQVPDARTFATLNIGGSGTTIVSLVIGR